MAVGLRDAADRSESLIDGLLVLARSEQGDLPQEPVDLADGRAAALDQSAADAAGAGLRVERAIRPGAGDGQPGAARAAGGQPGAERRPSQRRRAAGCRWRRVRGDG